MLLDAIATVILTGLMLVPLVNVLVGGVAGGGLLGPLGVTIGVLLAIAITALETRIADHLGWRDLRPEPEGAPELMAEEVSLAPERTIKTGPPSPRRQSRLAQEAKPVRRTVRLGKMQRGAVH
jgi:hypothetical protein